MKTEIGGVILGQPFMNAACSVAKTPEDIAALSATSVGAVVIGSITPLAREGNPEPRWFDAGHYALNSFGMPNGGLEYYQTELPNITKLIHDANKVAILSVAGFSANDYAKLAELADASQVDLLELNFGCPNVRSDGQQKPIASFNPEYMSEIVHAVADTTDLPLMLKLSPYSNPAELQIVAKTIAELPNIAAVVTSNTFANGYAEVSAHSALAMEYGGVSGPNLKPISLGQVRQFRAILPETIAVIGVGGIETADDAREYVAAGAIAVQAATLIVRDGHQAIERIKP